MFITPGGIFSAGGRDHCGMCLFVCLFVLFVLASLSFPSHPNKTNKLINNHACLLVLFCLFLCLFVVCVLFTCFVICLFCLFLSVKLQLWSCHAELLPSMLTMSYSGIHEHGAVRHS